MKIRKYRKEDEDKVMEIIEQEGEQWRDYFAPENQAMYRKALEQSVTYIALENGMVCGFSRSLDDHACSIFVCDLLVTAKFRGKDVGKQLMECLCDDYPSKTIYAMSDVDEYYEKQGYKNIGSIFLINI